MKKLLFSMVVATLMTACATPVINQTELYGTVESVIYLNGYYHAKTWCEGPYTDEGKQCGVFHYRLFCDAAWQPIKPRGEVYTREFTEAGWKSYSELHGK